MTSAIARPRLFTGSFLTLNVVAFLGFSQNYLVQPVLPLLILSRGGDATVVGLIVAIYTVPSIVLRPFIGRWMDERGIHRAWSLGAAALGVVGFLYLVPSWIVLVIVRIVHGASWALFSTSNHATLAQSVPREMRGRATSVYTLMPGVAQMIMPGAALLLFNAFGFEAAFCAAAVLGLTAFVIIRRGRVPTASRAVPALVGASARGGLLERAARLPMAIEFLFTSTAPIFFTFLPVFALQRGIPIAALALFFPVYGVIFAGARVVVAPFADRIGTGRLLSFSVLSASAGLGLGLFANELIGITLAGALYALGSAIETPATMALAIDRSEPGRVGAAMATYSLGFQAAQGVGAAAFGLIVHNFGFPAPFVVGLLTQIVLLGVIVRHRRELASSHQPDTLADVQADALVPE